MAHGKPSVSELRAGEALIQVGLWGPGPRPRPLPGGRAGRGWLLCRFRTSMNSALEEVDREQGSRRRRPSSMRKSHLPFSGKESAQAPRGRPRGRSDGSDGIGGRGEQFKLLPAKASHVPAR